MLKAIYLALKTGFKSKNLNFIMNKFIKASIFLLLFSASTLLNAQTKKFITVKGKEVIGTDNKPFLMKGTNLGNWLVPEGYMFQFKSVNSPRLINEALTELLGPEDIKAFWKKYQDSYITAADIHFLKATGMNSIRIPFNYRLFTAETYCGQNNPNRGFELLDRVIGWCKKEGLYVTIRGGGMNQEGGGVKGDDGYYRRKGAARGEKEAGRR